MSSNAVSVLDIVSRTLQATQMKEIITKALPPGVSEDRFTRATITAIRQNPDILECDRNSLYNAVVRCAQDGLMPDGKQAAIVAFNHNFGTKSDPKWGKKAQHMPMVEGCIHLLAKAGVFAYAVSVYANDSIEIWNDENGQHVKHIPTKMGADRGARIGAFALGKTKDGQVYVEAMDMNDLEVPKRATKQRDSQGNLTGPWRDTPDRMEQKSALHRLAKRVPHAALRDDDEFRDDDPETPSEHAPRGADASPPPPAPSSTGSPPPSSAKARSKALQSIVDAGATDAVEAAASSDPQPDPEPETKPDKPAVKSTPKGDSEVF